MSASHPPGTRVGRYEIRSLLGVGGMGEVYLAHDSQLRRPVALKLLPLEFTQNEDRLQRFEREALAASALNHPNIVTVYEIDADVESHYIVTEFIGGQRLHEHLEAAGGQLEITQVLEIAIQVGSALAAAHEAGIAHRDIKPDNIMIRPDGVIKVLDFGLAKTIAPEAGMEKLEAVTRMRTTNPGTIMGTVFYMSPEQVRGRTVDTRTDVWSLACVIYEMVTGRVPFEGESTGDVIAGILKSKPRPLARYAATAPAELESIVKKGLRKKRAERYQMVKDMLEDLKRLKRQLEFELELERSSAPHAEVIKQHISKAPRAPVRRKTLSQPELAKSHEQTVLIPPVRRTGAGYLTTLSRNKTGVALAGGLAVLGVAAAIYFLWLGRTNKSIDSIAVLPFVNASGDPKMDYVSDGICESLINALSQIPRLKVIARSSSFKYKGQEVDPQEVAKSLGVEAVFTGRVSVQSDNIIIHAELVDTRNKRQLWGEQYTRKITDLMALQNDISREISDNLKLKLTSEEEKLLNKRYTEDAEAYELYLKGRYEWARLSVEGWQKALDYFDAAVKKDPNYALAYSGESDAYAGLAFRISAPKEVMPKAKAAAIKALELDSQLAEAHVSLANILERYDWDRQGAEREYREAMRLNPNYVLGLNWYGLFLMRSGRSAEAVAELKRGLESDPLSIVVTTDLGWAYYHARQYDLAIEEFKKALAMDKGFAWAHNLLGFAYLQQGKHKEALGEIQSAVDLSGRQSAYLAFLARVNAISGNRNAVTKALDELNGMSQQRYVSPYYMSTVYAAMNDKEETFKWLEKAYDERDLNLVYLNVDPVFDGLRDDPRLKTLLNNIGYSR
jgi:eukaryotic-like serine/threonine-protein kinase